MRQSLIVASHARAMGAVVNMMAMKAKCSVATPARTDGNVRTALFGGKHWQAEMTSEPEAESRASQEGPG